MWEDGVGMNLSIAKYIKFEQKSLMRIDARQEAKPMHRIVLELAFGAFQSPLTPLHTHNYMRDVFATLRIVRRPSGALHLRLFGIDGGCHENHPHNPEDDELFETATHLLIACQYQACETQPCETSWEFANPRTKPNHALALASRRSSSCSTPSWTRWAISRSRWRRWRRWLQCS